jgi:hypothetical protein
VNLLEDEKASLEVQSVPSADGGLDEKDTVLDVNFRAFQVVSIKLTVQGKPAL